MPTPDRTSLEQIVAAGRELLESGGPSALTMQAVAARVGVRAPSLYKRVKDRDALLRLVADATVDDLAGRLDAVARQDGTLPELATALRAFAHERPEGFRLMFAAGPGPSEVALRRSVAPVLTIAERMVGPDAALDAARTITAWASGFIGMELSGAFRMGGDVDRAFAFGVERLTAALTL